MGDRGKGGWWPGRGGCSHHGEEVAHYPLEDHGEDEEDGADEEEDAAVLLLALFLVFNAREEEGRGVGWTYTTGVSPEAPPQPIMTMENVKVEMTKPTKPRAVGLA